MDGYICIDGEVVAASEARVSAADRGFLYGDGLFETMRIEQGRIHLLERHLRRLRAGAESLEIETPEDAELRDALRRTIAANGETRSILRLTLTRGIALGGPASDCARPTYVVMQRPLLHEGNFHGARLVVLERTLPAPDTPTRIKTTSYLGYVLAAREAARRGADEGVMLTREGMVAEGTVSSIFIVRDGALRTAPLSLGVLPGIARGRILELAVALGITTSESPFGLDELRAADECFFSNAARGITIAGSIDGAVLSPTTPVATALAEAYRAEMPNEDL